MCIAIDLCDLTVYRYMVVFRLFSRGRHIQRKVRCAIILGLSLTRGLIFILIVTEHILNCLSRSDVTFKLSRRSCILSFVKENKMGDHTIFLYAILISFKDKLWFDIF